MPGRLTRLSLVDARRTDDAPVPRLKPRGLPPALAPHGVYSATNPAEAAMYGRDLLGSHRVVLDDSTVGLSTTYHGVLVRDVTLGYLDYGADVTVRVHELGCDTLVIVPATGEVEVDNGDAIVHASPVMAVIPQPETALTLRCPRDAALLVVRIDRSALDLHLSRLLGRTVDRPIEFDLAFDLSTGTASRWNFAIQMLHAELLDDRSLLHRGVGLGQLEEFVMSSLLYSQPSNFADQLSAPAGQTVRRAVRRGCAFIEQNLADPLGVDDIAAAAEVSVRTLQSQFMADLDQTPTAYIKNRRLERARADLADARSGSGVTVTDIATRWGFRHLGRFSVSYRARFGETPSQTLRS